MTDKPRCSCGIPSEANWLVEITYGVGDSSTGTETDYEYQYFCEDDLPGDHRDLIPVGRKEDWYIIESSERELR